MAHENTLITRDLSGDRLTIKAGGTLRIDDDAILEIADGVNFVPAIGAGAIVEEDGIDPADEFIGQVHHTRITLDGLVITTTDATTSGAHGSQDLYTFPRGNIYVIGGTTDLTIVGDGVGLGASAAVVGAVGSVAAAADATLSSTEADIIPSTVSTLSTSTGHMRGKSTTPKMFDNTTTTNATQAKAKLNFAVPDAGTSADGSLTVTGTVDIHWINLGDN